MNIWKIKGYKQVLNMLNLTILMFLVACQPATIGEIRNSATSIFQSNIHINLPDVDITEGDSTALVLTFSSPATKDFTLRWTISGTGASTDFPILTGTVPVLKGQTSVTKTIASNNNLISDGTRNYTLTIDSVDGTVLDPLSVNYTVNDDDPSGVPSLTILDVTSNEGTGAGNTTYTFSVGLSFVTGLNVTVDYTTVDGTATALDLDYIATSGTLTIPAGSSTGTFTVSVPRDATFETNEAFTVQLSGGTNYSTVGSTLSASGNITNDDTAPTISLNSPSVTEGNGAGISALSYDVTLSAPSGVNVVVNFATSDGTATLADSDYITSSSTLTIPAGSTTASIVVNAIRDVRYELDETVGMTLSGGSGYTVAGSILTNVGTITNDDTQPTVTIADVTSTEGTGAGNKTFAFAVTLSTASSVNVVLNYATSNGTATSADLDFVASSGTLTIPAGSTSGSINISVPQDSKFEPNENFNLTLSGGSGYTALGSTLTAVGNINDDDSAPTVSIANVAVNEGTGAGTTNFTFTVSLSAASGTAVSLNYATSNGTATVADSDYTALSGTLTIPAGSTSGTITVVGNQDSKFEVNELFNLTLSGGSGYTVAGSTLTATGTMNNDDTAPTISIANVSQAEGNSGSTSSTFTVSLSAASGVSVVVNYATSDGTAATADLDYTGVSSSITIAAGSTSGTFNITSAGDTKFEANETYTVTLSGGSGYTSAGSTLSASGTITNDDTAPTISIANVTANEGNGAGTASFTYTVSLSAVSGVAVSVNYATSDSTATTADLDYTALSGTLTIPVGSASGTFTVLVNNDTKFENTETFDVTLSGGAGYTVAGSTLTATGTITNDDTAPTISITAVTTAEGNGAGTTTMTYTVTLSAASGNAVSVNYATTDGTATTADSDYTAASGTLTIPAGSTTGSFNVLVNKDAINEVNETYTVTLSSGSGYTVAGSTLSATGTITNDDTAPTISIANVTNN